MKSDRLDTLKKALGLAALTKARSTRKSVTSKSPATAVKATAPGMARTAPILIDDIPDFEIHLKVRVEPGKKPPVSRGEAVRATHRLKKDALQPGLDAETAAFLQKLEPKLLKWLAESRKNATHFLVDPVGALMASGIVTDPARIARLRSLRPKPPRPEKVPRSFQITHVEIDVDQS
ncbi:MAG: hypothetical protein Tsb0019_16430 [Roseibium sp.]